LTRCIVAAMVSAKVVFVLACFIDADAAVVKAKVTPVEKVVELLKKVDAQLVQEGKDEATQYDKYACFCKEQADNKIYSIEQSEKKEAELTATINDLEADIKTLNGEISDLGIKITDLGHEIGNKTEKREAEHATYVANDKEVSEAISACERAIEALKESKGNLEGNVEAEALVQMKKVAVLAFAMQSASTVTDKQWNTLAQLSKAGEPGDAYDYKYHSNDIIATLEGLRTTFLKEKRDLYDAEFEANALFDSQIVDLSNEKAFAEADKLEKEKIEAYKSELKAKAEEDLTTEQDHRQADERFMGVLKNDCEEKATLFDERSRVRVDELAAISKAMEALTTGVVPTWKANRKLNGLQKAPAKVVKGVSKPASFVQLRGSNSASKAAKMRESVLAVLKGSASRLSSAVLAVTALKVEAAEDHFVKVRSMINDIIATLEAQAKAEATTKSWCDKEMKAAVTTRDAEQAKVEDLEGQISQLEADKAQLLQEIAELSDEIAKTQKALLEATELRAEDKKDNLHVISETGIGRDAVEYAIEILQDFYDEHEFLQTGYVPPNSDRDGNTVGDLAPEYQHTTERYKVHRRSLKVSLVC